MTRSIHATRDTDQVGVKSRLEQKKTIKRVAVLFAQHVYLICLCIYMSAVFPSSNNLPRATNLPNGSMRKTFRDCARSPEYICMFHFSRVFIRCWKFAVSETATGRRCKVLSRINSPQNLKLYAILL